MVFDSFAIEILPHSCSSNNSITFYIMCYLCGAKRLVDFIYMQINGHFARLMVWNVWINRSHGICRDFIQLGLLKKYVGREDKDRVSAKNALKWVSNAIILGSDPLWSFMRCGVWRGLRLFLVFWKNRPQTLETFCKNFKFNFCVWITFRCCYITKTPTITKTTVTVSAVI